MSPSTSRSRFGRRDHLGERPEPGHQRLGERLEIPPRDRAEQHELEQLVVGERLGAAGEEALAQPPAVSEIVRIGPGRVRPFPGIAGERQLRRRRRLGGGREHRAMRTNIEQMSMGSFQRLPGQVDRRATSLAAAPLEPSTGGRSRWPIRLAESGRTRAAHVHAPSNLCALRPGCARAPARHRDHHRSHSEYR